MLRKLTAFAVMSTLLAAPLAAETLILGTEGAYPPFNFISADGTIGGFDVEIGQALCQKMNVTCEIVAQDWDGIIPGLIAKKYDFIIASMFITEERKKQVAFTNPYYMAAMSHVVPKDSDITEFSADSLAGKVIGAQSGTTQADYITALYTNSDIRLYPTQDEVNLDLAAGRLDLQVGDMLPMLEWSATEEGSCCQLAGEPITDPAFVGEGVGIALRQEDGELLARMNKALEEIRADGTYKAINDKFFKIDVYTMK